MGLGDAIGDGRKTVAASATAEKLASATKCTSVTITALAANTGLIVVGSSTVVAAAATRRGIPLAAGETVSIPTVDLDQIWLDTTVNGDGVSYAWVNDVRK